MSVKVSALIWEMRGCSAIQKLVLLKLADHASDDGRNIHPKQRTVAEDCECGVRSVQRVLQWACDEGLLQEIPGPGNRPKTYRFLLDAVRQRVALNDQNPVRHTGRVTESQGDSLASSVRHTDALSTPHRRAINKEPLYNHQEPSEKMPFSSQRFAESWAEWVQFRREKKQSLTPTTIRKQFAQLSKVSEDEAIARIEQSITNGWTGLFAVKENHGKQSSSGYEVVA